MNDSDLSKTSSLAADIQVLHHERLNHNENPMIGYLNINSLWNKLTALKTILKYLSLDYFVISETKLDESSPNEFTIDEIRARGDKIKFGEVLLSTFEKVWSVRGVPNMSRNPLSVYVLKLLFLRKSG